LSVVPNPFNPQTEIRFALPQGARATLAIFDIRGRKIRTLVESDLPAGEHLAIWEGRDDSGQAQPSGVYLAKLSAGTLELVHRLTLLQ
jgi:flagellar hook assembly protein FlgD